MELENKCFKFDKPQYGILSNENYRLDSKIGSNLTNDYLPILELSNSSLINTTSENKKIITYTKLSPVYKDDYQTYEKYNKKTRETIYFDKEERTNYKKILDCLINNDYRTNKRFDIELGTFVVTRNSMGIHDIKEDVYKTLMTLCIKTSKLQNVTINNPENNFDKLVLLVDSELVDYKRFYTKIFSDYIINVIKKGIEIVFHNNIESLIYIEKPIVKFNSLNQRKEYLNNIINNLSV